jgi:DDE superfamily endonuclease
MSAQRQWARRGTRPRQPADQRYESAYLFGAICPARGVGAALVLPFADTEAMQLHLEEISRHIAEGAHAVLMLDRAGWHTTAKLDVPSNITPIFLPSRAPELNPVENIWQFLRGNWLSNLVFETYDDIIDAVCAAWRKLVAQPEPITSIGTRDWATSVSRYDLWYDILRPKRTAQWMTRKMGIGLKMCFLLGVK